MMRIKKRGITFYDTSLKSKQLDQQSILRNLIMLFTLGSESFCYSSQILRKYSIISVLDTMPTKFSPSSTGKA